MKILLLSANTMTHPYPVYPLGIDHVAAAIADDHQVKIVDINVEPSMDSLAATIMQICPDAIGISLRNVDNTEVSDSQSFIDHYRTIVAIARKHSEAPIILGGSGFTIFPDLLMHTLNADYGVVGEGECLKNLLDAIDNNSDVSTIPGVIVRKTGVKPPEQVAATALNAGAKYLFITDSTFNADLDHSLAVAATFRQAGVSIP